MNAGDLGVVRYANIAARASYRVMSARIPDAFRIILTVVEQVQQAHRWPSNRPILSVVKCLR